MSIESISESMKGASLLELGWGNAFIQQLSLDEWDDCLPARIIEQHKSEVTVATEQGCFSVTLPVQLDFTLAVGDWVLLDKQKQLVRVLERNTVFARKAAGAKVKEQLIAANVDTVFIVCSMNQDFNLNRIERYLVLANEAGAEAVVVLTKADLCESQQVVSDFIDQAQALDPYLMVEALNALDESSLEALSPWCKVGKTVALLGSSGVGKSTISNLLMGQSVQSTAGIREDDSKGRHTTTSRSLHLIPKGSRLSGGLLLDTPGMRELQLANVEAGIEETFSDVLAFAENCKFSDCTHASDLPEGSGCRVQGAIKAGELPERRLLSYQKLQREDQLNSSSLAERRDKDKQFGKMIKSVMKDVKSRKQR